MIEKFKMNMNKRQTSEYNHNPTKPGTTSNYKISILIKKSRFNLHLPSEQTFKSHLLLMLDDEFLKDSRCDPHS